ncbi:MAG: hypothetical protein R3F29_03005 [Planctomycetota bacterium]
MHTRLLLASLLPVLLGLQGCAGLIMSTEELPGSDANIALSSGAAVFVPTPTVSSDAKQNLTKATIDHGTFQADVQRAVIEALNANGAKAQAGSGSPSLQINVTEYNYGSGAARAFGFGGQSGLNGTAILTTPQGVRKVKLTKTGSKGGVAAAGDQTRENIGYFATALANNIVGQ